MYVQGMWLEWKMVEVRLILKGQIVGKLPLGRIGILHQERRGQVKTMAMEHFNDILFHKSEPANKQHTNQ